MQDWSLLSSSGLPCRSSNLLDSKEALFWLIFDLFQEKILEILGKFLQLNIKGALLLTFLRVEKVGWKSPRF